MLANRLLTGEKTTLILSRRFCASLVIRWDERPAGVNAEMHMACLLCCFCEIELNPILLKVRETTIIGLCNSGL